MNPYHEMNWTEYPSTPLFKPLLLKKTTNYHQSIIRSLLKEHVAAFGECLSYSNGSHIETIVLEFFQYKLLEYPLDLALMYFSTVLIKLTVHVQK